MTASRNFIGQRLGSYVLIAIDRSRTDSTGQLYWPPESGIEQRGQP